MQVEEKVLFFPAGIVSDIEPVANNCRNTRLHLLSSSYNSTWDGQLLQENKVGSLWSIRYDVQRRLTNVLLERGPHFILVIDVGRRLCNMSERPKSMNHISAHLFLLFRSQKKLDFPLVL